jgi:hypothetical protein
VNGKKRIMLFLYTDVLKRVLKINPYSSILVTLAKFSSVVRLEYLPVRRRVFPVFAKLLIVTSLMSSPSD